MWFYSDLEFQSMACALRIHDEKARTKIIGHIYQSFQLKLFIEEKRLCPKVLKVNGNLIIGS